ncbi:hypothetical protein RE474_00940 [Methanolobus sediminis]|uniref:Uncharacterized protein n=1 Tax=Methanolobus sediminis TaxID=3072978 RepID=A0AA51YJ83_9EURY|nr:hypothetical protein [Methanolobus sediminis]WMW25316.1 hypothetical protein RE474_00940 [Methanolobus sediminis]
MKKRTIAIIGIVLLFLLFSGGDDDSSSSAEWDSMVSDSYDVDRAASMSIYESLAFQGIDYSVVEVTEEHVLVKYDQPPVKSDTDALFIWFYIMGVAAETAPDTDEVIIEMYDGTEELYEVTVQTSDIQDYLDSYTTLDEFKTKVNVRAVM